MRHTICFYLEGPQFIVRILNFTKKWKRTNTRRNLKHFFHESWYTHSIWYRHMNTIYELYTFWVAWSDSIESIDYWMQMNFTQKMCNNSSLRITWNSNYLRIFQIFFWLSKELRIIQSNKRFERQKKISIF